MKNILVLLFLSFSFFGFSQKINLKKGEVTVDKQLWLKYDGCGITNNVCSLYNLNGEEIIFIKFHKIQGVQPVSNFSDGSLNYSEVIFLGKDKKFEIRDSNKNIVKLLYNSKVLNDDGTLNIDSINRLSEKYGTEFSDKYNVGKTIIINN